MYRSSCNCSLQQIIWRHINSCDEQLHELRYIAKLPEWVFLNAEQWNTENLNIPKSHESQC
jgi:hypothetical protein